MTEPRPFVVVDASVAVKWFVSEDEAGVDEAAALLDRHAKGDIQLVSSAVLPFEVLGALRRGKRDAPALSEAIEALYDVGIALHAPSRAVAALAASLIANQGVSTFDAAYSALAASLECPLATADRRLVKALGTEVETIAV